MKKSIIFLGTIVTVLMLFVGAQSEKSYAAYYEQNQVVIGIEHIYPDGQTITMDRGVQKGAEVIAAQYAEPR